MNTFVTESYKIKFIRHLTIYKLYLSATAAGDAETQALCWLLSGWPMSKLRLSTRIRLYSIRIHSSPCTWEGLLVTQVHVITTVDCLWQAMVAGLVSIEQ